MPPDEPDKATMNALIKACDAGLLKPDEAQPAILAVKEGLDLPANAAEAIAPERGVRDAERLDQMELAAKAKARLGISKLVASMMCWTAPMSWESSRRRPERRTKSQATVTV